METVDAAGIVLQQLMNNVFHSYISETVMQDENTTMRF